MRYAGYIQDLLTKKIIPLAGVSSRYEKRERIVRSVIIPDAYKARFDQMYHGNMQPWKLYYNANIVRRWMNAHGAYDMRKYEMLPENKAITEKFITLDGIAILDKQVYEKTNGRKKFWRLSGKTVTNFEVVGLTNQYLQRIRYLKETKQL